MLLRNGHVDARQIGHVPMKHVIFRMCGKEAFQCAPVGQHAPVVGSVSLPQHGHLINPAAQPPDLVLIDTAASLVGQKVELNPFSVHMAVQVHDERFNAAGAHAPHHIQHPDWLGHRCCSCSYLAMRAMDSSKE